MVDDLVDAEDELGARHEPQGRGDEGQDVVQGCDGELAGQAGQPVGTILGGRLGGARLADLKFYCFKFIITWMFEKCPTSWIT